MAYSGLIGKKNRKSPSGGGKPSKWNPRHVDKETVSQDQQDRPPKLSKFQEIKKKIEEVFVSPLPERKTMVPTTEHQGFINAVKVVDRGRAKYAVRYVGGNTLMTFQGQFFYFDKLDMAIAIRETLFRRFKIATEVVHGPANAAKCGEKVKEPVSKLKKEPETC